MWDLAKREKKKDVPADEKKREKAEREAAEEPNTWVGPPPGSGHGKYVQLSVGLTSHPDLHETWDLFTEGSRPGPTYGGSVGLIFRIDCSDWSNGIRYHIFVTRPDTEFKGCI
jgi:hypothetical protein